MREIRVKFVDFWSNFKPENSIIYECMCKLYDVILCEDPQYLIYSVFGTQHFKYENCVKIFWTGECLVPDFNLCDYAIGNAILDYGDRYVRVPDFYSPPYRKDLELCSHKHEKTDAALKNKNGFCSFVYSNRYANPQREYMFEKLSGYKVVHSGGRYLNNIGDNQGVKDKLAFQKNYKFSIACENSSVPGYTTEKLVQSFAAQTVPIYWGDPRVSDVFNSKAFICVSDFDSLEEMVEYVKEVDQNDEKWLEIMNEPAFVSDAKRLNDMITDVTLFIKNICEQPLEEAYRRNRDYFGGLYQREQKERAEHWNGYAEFNRGRLSKIAYALFKKMHN